MTRFILGVEVAESGASLGWFGGGVGCREGISCCEGGWELVGSGSFTGPLSFAFTRLGFLAV